ncbi:hypothetical protein VTO73DRAFT_2350 [Trametes versicolor]
MTLTIDPGRGPLLPTDPIGSPVYASLRATGYDGLPDTYYLLSFPQHIKTVGVGSQFLMKYGGSVYRVALGPVRVRGKQVVEFIAFCHNFTAGFCYVQVPALQARISKFAIIDFLRGIISLTDPVPERHVLAVPPLPTRPIKPSPGSRASSIEVYVAVETSVAPVADSKW